MRGPKRMDRERLDAVMSTRGLDAVVAVMPENVYYASGTLITTTWNIRERLALAVFPHGTDPTLIVCNIEESLAREESWIEDLRTYVEFAESPIDMLADVLTEKGLTEKKVGIELSYLAAAYYLRLQERLPGVELADSTRLFDELRAVKSAEEVALLKHAVNLTEQAIYATFAEARLGDTEKEIADQINSRQLALGADANAFSVLGVGENIFHAHPNPGARSIGEGDLLRLDVGSSFDGYYSDVARMAVGGRPTGKQRNIYKALRDVQRDTIAQMKPGLGAADLYNYCVKAFESKGLEMNLPHIGHSIGIGLHEWPMIEPRNLAELQAGMVINIEPLYIDRSVGAFHLEDLVHVTPDGPVILSDYSDTEELFGIK